MNLRIGLGIVACALSAVVANSAWRGTDGTRHSVLVADRPSRNVSATGLVVAISARPTAAPGIRADLFEAPAQSAPPTLKASAASSSSNKPVPTTLDPLADYAFAGVVSVGSERFALVENRKTREGRYLRVGDTFEGRTVRGFDNQGLTLAAAGIDRRIAMNSDYKLTPLDRDGMASGAPLPPGKPAQPGQPAPPPAGMPVMPGPADLSVMNAQGAEVAQLKAAAEAASLGAVQTLVTQESGATVVEPLDR